MNKKGQALIEFVLILPILIMIIFGIIDFGNIMVTKNNLENRVNDAVEILKETNNEETIRSVVNNGTNNNVELILTYGEEYLTIKVEVIYKIITPGLNKILGEPYKVSTERVVKYAQQ